MNHSTAHPGTRTPLLLAKEKIERRKIVDALLQIMTINSYVIRQVFKILFCGLISRVPSQVIEKMKMKRGNVEGLIFERNEEKHL